jgi:hypothetical protein
MKLYYFHPNDYGEEFFTVASSEEDAINSLNKFLEETKYPRDGWGKDSPPLYWGHRYFKKYTIKVYNPGEVVNTEIS